MFDVFLEHRVRVVDDVLEVARSEAQTFIANPPTATELKDAVPFIRDHWQRRYGLVQVG